MLSPPGTLEFSCRHSNAHNNNLARAATELHCVTAQQSVRLPSPHTAPENSRTFRGLFWMKLITLITSVKTSFSPGLICLAAGASLCLTRCVHCAFGETLLVSACSPLFFSPPRPAPHAHRVLLLQPMSCQITIKNIKQLVRSWSPCDILAKKLILTY